MTKRASVDFQVTILGGGMVGSCLALQLGQRGISTLVLDSAAPGTHWQPDRYDVRASAITRATQNIFQNLGVWEAMAARRVCPFRDMRVWDGAGGGAIHFDGAHVAQATLGHIVENSVMVDALRAALLTLDGVELLAPATLESFTPGQEHVALRLTDGRKFQTRLLVGADGARSWLREQLHIDTVIWDYHQSALVATVRTELSHQETAWQRFLPTGPLAFLPLLAPYCSIVWSNTPQAAQSLSRLDEREFNERLSAAFEHRLGAVEVTGPRAVFPLRLLHAREYVRPRIALVGDAAHNIHPLAGQGVNLGFADAATLGELIVGAHKRAVDPGSFLLLRRYERWRKGQNLATMAVMDGFKRLFGNSAPPMVALRGAGMSLTDRAHVVKNLISRYAMGLEGDLPALARSSPVSADRLW